MKFTLKSRSHGKALAWLMASALSIGLLVACGGDGDAEATPLALTLSKIGGFTHTGGATSSEISAYDPASKRLFVVNGAQRTVEVLSLADPTAPALVATILATDLWPDAGGVNSVDARGGMVALAIEASTKTNAGRMVLLRAADLVEIARAEVGSLPDMLTFTPDGRKILVANEGEPNSYGQVDSVDPEGSISIVDVSALTLQSTGQILTARTADFLAYNSQMDTLLAAGVRIFGPNATVAKDLEPEYITVSDDSTTAYVTLQENNAVAVVDIASARVTDIKALGYKDHSLLGMGMDVSDEDGGSNTNSGTPLVKIGPVPVKGLYMPDGIAQFSVGGRTYLVTAKNTAGECNELVTFGARSFSIWNDRLERVYDSGDQFEQLTKDLLNVRFNASNDDNTLDSRSPAKGPEPEGVVVAKFGRKTYAFIGLERVGGVMVYDISNPASPMFETYLNTRDGATGDRGPEGLHLIKASDSPNGKPLLVVANETSGTTAIFQINLSY